MFAVGALRIDAAGRTYFGDISYYQDNMPIFAVLLAFSAPGTNIFSELGWNSRAWLRNDEPGRQGNMLVGREIAGFRVILQKCVWANRRRRSFDRGNDGRGAYRGKFRRAQRPAIAA
jgi:hypothetical protein